MKNSTSTPEFKVYQRRCELVAKALGISLPSLRSAVEGRGGHLGLTTYNGEAWFEELHYTRNGRLHRTVRLTDPVTIQKGVF